MHRRAVNVFVNGNSWFVGLAGDGDDALRLDVDLPADATAAEQVQKLLGLMREHDAAPGIVVLALPSTWCFAASISTAGLLKRQRQQAMLYRLEEKLPLDAEDLAADFLHVSDAALGICTRASQLQPLIAALEESGFFVSAICPRVLLTLQALRAAPDTAESAIYLIQADERVDLLCVQDNVLRRWASVTAELGAVALALRREQLDGNGEVPVVSVGVDAALLAALNEPVQRQDTVLPDDAAIRAAAEILVRGGEPPVNLRRGPLAPADPLQQVHKPLSVAAAALAILLLSISGVLLWRAHQFSSQADHLQDQLRSLFVEAFPNQPPPAAILARLRSEAANLRGLSGTGADLPDRASALDLLHRSLTAMPTNLRYRVLELRLDDQRLYLEGQARSHADVSAIANALRSAAGFDVQPPPTENLTGGGVAFTLVAPLEAPREVKR